jgi:hypothetical protein
MQWLEDGLPFPSNPAIQVADTNNNVKHQPYTLLIDDLDVFAALPPSFLESRYFLTQTHKLLKESSSVQSPNESTHLDSIIMYGRDCSEKVFQISSIFQFSNNAPSTVSPSVSPISSLAEHMKYFSTCILSISPLQTGRHDSVHGILTITIPSDDSCCYNTNTNNNNNTNTNSNNNNSKAITMKTHQHCHHLRRVTRLQYRALETTIWVMAVSGGGGNNNRGQPQQR